MTKKDVELIARALRTARDLTLDRFGLDIAAEALAEELAITNPRFDRQRFLVACGVGE